MIGLLDYKLKRARVKALLYTGAEMNTPVMALFPGNFVHAFIETVGDVLLPEVHGLDIPKPGDYLIFDADDGQTLIGVMDSKQFCETYEPVEILNRAKEDTSIEKNREGVRREFLPSKTPAWRTRTVTKVS